MRSIPAGRGKARLFRTCEVFAVKSDMGLDRPRKARRDAELSIDVNRPDMVYWMCCIRASLFRREEARGQAFPGRAAPKRDAWGVESAALFPNGGNEKRGTDVFRRRLTVRLRA